MIKGMIFMIKERLSRRRKRERFPEAEVSDDLTLHRFFVLFLSSFILLTTVALLPKGGDTRPFTEKLEDRINDASMETYQDSLFGYTVRYPAFFEQTPDSLIDEPGACRFSYWDNWIQIVQMAFIQSNPRQLTVGQGMNNIGRYLHATKESEGKDFFILSGPLYIDGSRINGYRFHAKYVRHRRIWFVLQLTYPGNCSKAVRRIIRQIDEWKVWENRSSCGNGYEIPVH
ncbi:MAG: hypothetical protein LKF06_10340 [Prevotella sp.]|jgi:hypothetical protein|nr:hypothetical protein [Prevotella sp.]MCH4100952.1 hypothetical protein [Prevotella sp.]MCI1549166.1 hypothetical protein [Prevotella sp.]MCI1595336.1 hypothetical protein [Prevotella sp.]